MAPGLGGDAASQGDVTGPGGEGDGGFRANDGSAGADGGPELDDGQIHGPYAADELTKLHCDPARPAFAYQASYGPVSVATNPPRGMLAPIPCLTLTSYGSAESSIAVSSQGDVLYAPAFTADGTGVLRSSDQGKTWTLQLPKFENGGHHGRVQPYLYLDPRTDRVFFATNAAAGFNTSDLLGFNLTWSADLGDTWTHVAMGQGAFDWVKIYAGPPVTSQLGDYPDIVYASAPTPISTPVPYASLVGLTPDTQDFWRSLDGGKTWESAGSVSIKASDVPNCDPNEWVIFGSGTVNSKGTAFQVLRRCTRLAVAVSTDEGKSWQTREIPGSHMPAFDTRDLTGIVQNPNVLATELLTVDSENTLYVVYVDDQGSLRFTISKDDGRTWSVPVTVNAPDVTNVIYGSVAVKDPGTLAIAYYGSRDGVKYDGYIAETQNAFDAEPSFIGVIANDPKDPLYPWGFQVGYLGILQLADLNEIVQVKYAPNGDIWASFVKDMCKGANLQNCTWDIATHAKSEFQGAIGRLVHGVKTGWGSTGPRAPAAAACDEANPDLIHQCSMTVDTVTQAQNVELCTELSSCICDHCACEVSVCSGDELCEKVVACAAANNCRGQECLVLGCQDVVLEAGDLQTARALDVANCAKGNSCPALNFCPFDWLSKGL